MPHQNVPEALAYPSPISICFNMKQPRALLLPPGWGASPSQGYPQEYVTGTHLYTAGGREAMWGKVSCLKKQHDDSHRPLDLKSNALTTTPPPP